jgi:hypothetical protein
MNQPTCKTCPYWDKSDDDPMMGECRHSAPTPLVRFSYVDSRDAVWAVTEEDAWCGQHPDVPAWIEAQREAHEAASLTGAMLQ